MSQPAGHHFPPGLILWKEADKLKYRVSRGTLTDGLAYLKMNKNTLLDLLQFHQSNSMTLFPLAENQKALWFLYQLAPDSCSYHIALAFRIKNAFNETHIKEAFSIIIRNNWILQSQFVNIDDSGQSIYQCVFDKPKDFFEIIEVPSRSDSKIDELINGAYRKPFHLENEYPFRVILFKSKDENILLIKLHHIVCDGISLKIIFEHFINTYSNLEKGFALQTETAACDFQNYIDKQHQFLNSSGSAEQLRFWKSELDTASHPLILKTDFERPAIPSFHGQTRYFKIESDLYRRIQEFLNQERVTPFIFLFTVFQLMLAEKSGQRTFCIGTPAAARTDRLLEKTVGYLINMLPIVCETMQPCEFRTQLQRNRAHIQSALENQDIPFPVLVERIATEHSLSRTPLFQVMFNLMNRKAIGSLVDLLSPAGIHREFRFDTLTLSPYKIFDQEGQFDLTFEILDNDETFDCFLKYNPDIFKEKTIREFQDGIIKLIDQILDHQDPVIVLNMEEETSQSQQEKSGISQIEINITGTFTVDNLVPFFQFWFNKMGFMHHIRSVGYNQVEQQLLNRESEFHKNANGYNIICLRIDDWILRTAADNPEKMIEKANHRMTQFAAALESYCNASSANPLFIILCPSSPDSYQMAPSKTVIEDIEKKIPVLSSAYPSVHCLTLKDIDENYTFSDYYEPFGEDIGHMPYTEDFLISLATLTSRKIYSMLKVPFKAVVADCDGTLWNGVLGEDGVRGLTIGQAEIALQEYLIELHQKGILICLCSKNEETDVREALNTHPEMILKEKHIAFSRFNWQPKSDNIRSLAQEMNIAPDSVVFIDDNPIEIAQMNAELPEVCSVQKKNDLDHIQYIKNGFMFDILKLTDEDRERTQLYIQNKERSAYQKNSLTFTEFMKGLNLKITMDPLNQNTLARTSQLSYRTNQFNTTTLRYSETELKALLTRPGSFCYTVHLEDRFGNYGLIGVFISEKHHETLYIESLFISCRALGKGVEYEILHFLADLAEKQSLKYLEIPFAVTERNKPAEQFLSGHFTASKNGSDSSRMIYLIPLKDAVSAVLDPERKTNAAVDIQNRGKRIQHTEPMHQDVILRNAFISEVIRHLFSLEQIKSRLVVNVQTVSSHSQSDSTGSNIEKILLSHWQNALQNPGLTINDNFFEAGGRSILIPKILIDLKKSEQINLQIVDIFQYPTIQSLAAYLDGKSVNPIQPDSISEQIMRQKSALNAQKMKFKSARQQN